MHAPPPLTDYCHSVVIYIQQVRLGPTPRAGGDGPGDGPLSPEAPAGPVMAFD